MIFGNKIFVQNAGYDKGLNCQLGYIIEDCNHVLFGDVIKDEIVEVLKRGNVIGYLNTSILHEISIEGVKHHYVRIDDGILQVVEGSEK